MKKKTKTKYADGVANKVMVATKDGKVLSWGCPIKNCKCDCHKYK